MFVVYDSGRNAKYPDCPKVHISWNNNRFETLDEALNYAARWLAGLWDGKVSETAEFLRLNALNKEYDYSGYGDTIEICEEK